MNTCRTRRSIGVWMLALALWVPLGLHAQSGYDEPGFDTTVGIPQAMWVGRVDREAGLVELDGKMYRVSESKPMGLMQDPGPRLNLADLKPGMRVLVATDGTLPVENHSPQVLGLWQMD